MRRKHIHFRGRVQGVGFRFTTRSIAADFDVTGFVKNLPNGEVELLAEGPNAELDGFLEELRLEMGTYIAGETVVDAAASGEFEFFEIRH